jgi:hypothetical protein
MTLSLTLNIRDCCAQLPDADGSEIVALSPAQGVPWGNSISVGHPRAGALQALHQTWHVESRRQFENKVYVITDDAHLHHFRTVFASL